MSENERAQAYEITWLIRRLFRAMSREAERHLQQWGLTAADRAVMEFLYPDQQLTVPSIASRYDVSRQHVQVTVNRLLKTEMLRTKPNPGHKSSRLLQLTVRGRQCFTGIRESESAIVSRMFEGIPGAGIRATDHALKRMLDNLNLEIPGARQADHPTEEKA